MEPDFENLDDLNDLAWEDSVSVDDSISDPSAESIHEMRAARILDYQMTGLQKIDSREACVAGITGTTMGFVLELEKSLKELFASAGGDAKHQQNLRETMETYLRLVRQLERLLQLEVRSAAVKMWPGTAYRPGKIR